MYTVRNVLTSIEFYFTLVVIGCVAFLAYGVSVDNDNTRYCFDHGMVKVHSDLGTKCVKFENLVSIP